MKKISERKDVRLLISTEIFHLEFVHKFSENNLPDHRDP